VVCGYQYRSPGLIYILLAILLCILSEQSGHVFAEVFALRLLYIHCLKVRINNRQILSQIQNSKSCTPKLTTGRHGHSQKLDCPNEFKFGCSA